MYKITLPQATLALFGSALSFANALRRADPAAWDAFTSGEVASIRSQWQLIAPSADLPERADIDLDKPLSTANMRTLSRALTMYIAAHDGRYSLVLDYLSPVLDWHPNPFALRMTLSQAECERLENKATPALAGLSWEEDLAFRSMASELGEMFKGSGRVVNPNLEALGIQFACEDESRVCH